MTDQRPTTQATTVRVRAGELTGTADSGVARFLGVPYAAPPFGERRFVAPHPVAPWTGVREATHYGLNAPQPPRSPLVPPVAPILNVGEGDILHLNIWAPTAPVPGGHPVLVWIHGGGLIDGSNRGAVFDGTRFAERGLVVVVPNFRLGIEGFAVLDGAPANLGLVDQLAALRWVRDEISAFGGNPDQVTVAGQSSGGNTAAVLLTSPATAGLVTRAIIQSAPLAATSIDHAAEMTRLIARHLEIEPTRAAFAAVPPDVLLEAQIAVTPVGIPGDGGAAFAPAIDGDLIPVSPDDAIRSGRADDRDLLIGVCREEHRLWVGPTGLLHQIDDAFVDALAATQVVPDVAVYRASRPDACPGDLIGAVLSDMQARGPMLEAVESRAARGAASYVYEFAWRSPVHDLGAAHAVDMPFVFATIDSDEGRALTGDDPPGALAYEMNATWARFARGEAPGWPAWDASRPTKVFDGATNPIELDRHPEERVALLEAVQRRRATIT